MAGRRITLTTRGVGALGLTPVSAVAGLLLGAEELVLLAIALLTLVLSGLVQSAYRAARAQGAWRVTVELSTEDVQVGDQQQMTVTVIGVGDVGFAPVWLEEPRHCWRRIRPCASGRPTRDRLPNPSSAVPISPRDDGASVPIQFPIPSARRGVFALRGVRVWCFDSFGLVAQLLATGPSATITVFPSPVDVELGDELLRGEQAAEDHHPPVSVLEPQRRYGFGDFSGIRTYIPGDRLRLLYWPALARTGELMVRHFDDSGPRRMHVVADLRPLVGPSGTESVLATVAGVGLQVLHRGTVLELSTTSGERMAIGPGPHARIALLRTIANMEVDRPPALAGTPALDRGDRGLHPMVGTPLVVTTAVGARALPESFGFAHLVIAP